MTDPWVWVTLIVGCAAFLAGCGVGYYAAATDLAAHETKAFERGFEAGTKA